MKSKALKIEINTREHFSERGRKSMPLAVDSVWFRGEADVPTFALDELLGTKLRALYQRKKGRDLFDLWLALTEQDVDPDEIVRCFTEYMTFAGAAATRAQFEANMAAKLDDALFVDDIAPLLRPGVEYDAQTAWPVVHESLVRRLRGEPWKGDSS